ncbi:MAG: Thioredoxin-like protein [Bacteroidetes bacterium]|nr:Thioredoxin-like protein [Bacteroidota bacterium]
MGDFNSVINSNELVLVDFFAEWCGPCKTLSPILTQVKAKLGEKIKILKVDVDKNPATASFYQIKGVPTLILFKNGRQIWKQSGVLGAPDLIKVITGH